MEVNPFAVHSKPANLQPEVSVAASEVVAQAISGSTAGLDALEQEVKDYWRSASRSSYSVTSSNTVWDKLGHWAASLVQRLADYAQKALDIAVHKFVIELCAMVISALFGALSRKGYGAMDISTKDVYYRQTGGTATTSTATAPSSSTDTRNPFSDWSSRTASAW